MPGITPKYWDRITTTNEKELSKVSKVLSRVKDISYKIKESWSLDSERDKDSKEEIYLTQDNIIVKSVKEYEKGVTEKEGYLAHPNLFVLDFFSNNTPVENLKKELSDLLNK